MKAGIARTKAAATVLRQKYWRGDLVTWAANVRHQPYVWGETDCVALMRTALQVQFGTDLFPTIPQWTSAKTALRIWAKIIKDGGFEAMFTALGGRRLVPRSHGCWPMGSILGATEDVGDLPAFGVVVEPITVQSDQEHGVVWTYPQADEVESAWLFERAVITHG